MLRALGALTEDQAQLPEPTGQITTANNSSSREADNLSASEGRRHANDIGIQAGRTPTYTK